MFCFAASVGVGESLRSFSRFSVCGLALHLVALQLQSACVVCFAASVVSPSSASQSSWLLAASVGINWSLCRSVVSVPSASQFRWSLRSCSRFLLVALQLQSVLSCLLRSFSRFGACGFAVQLVASQLQSNSVACAAV